MTGGDPKSLIDNDLGVCFCVCCLVAGGVAELANKKNT